jgi:hypothetical protein
MGNILARKQEIHRQFWQGKGPCLLFIPTPQLSNLDPSTEALDKYDTFGYKERFHSPSKMWESEMRRAREVVEWPTDGIPTVRPNLGTVFLQAAVGRKYLIPENQMPRSGAPLSSENIQNIKIANALSSDMMKLVEQFYVVHLKSAESNIVAYHPDTQGVFDLTHQIFGDTIFLDMALKESKVKYALDICSELYIKATHHIKNILGEPADCMMHGHGTPQGLYFPNAGVRMSEDSATLISPKMIDHFIIPYIINASSSFGGVFIHYCGKHIGLFEKVCALDCVKAIDLGNQEEYDLEWLLKKCAETDTIFFSRVMPENRSEYWEPYIRRIAKIQNKTKARCVLRSLVQPTDRDECFEMLNVWHDLTG